MQKRLQNLPAFSRQNFEKIAGGWRGLSSGPGSDRTVIEWSIGGGPRCFVYPASNRAAGKNLIEGIAAHTTDERYADWLEYEYVPQVVDALKAMGQNPQVICADLRPIQIQRARLRAQAAASLTKVAMGGAPGKAH